MPGARCTRSLVCIGRKHTSIHHRYPGTPGIPCAMVLTVSFVLSPVTGLVCHRHQRMLAVPVRSDRHASANLTPASGRQDHTTSPYAATSLVCSLGDRSQAFRQPALRSRRAQNAAASTASAPRVRDDRDTPLWWGGMRKVLDVIWGEWEQKYFSENQK